MGILDAEVGIDGRSGLLLRPILRDQFLARPCQHSGEIRLRHSLCAAVPLPDKNVLSLGTDLFKDVGMPCLFCLCCLEYNQVTETMAQNISISAIGQPFSMGELQFDRAEIQQ